MNKSKIEWQVGYYDEPADERLSREDWTVEIDLFDPTESDLKGNRCQAALVRVVELVAAGKHDITVTKMDDGAPVESFTWSPEIGHIVSVLDYESAVNLWGARENADQNTHLYRLSWVSKSGAHHMISTSRLENISDKIVKLYKQRIEATAFNSVTGEKVGEVYNYGDDGWNYFCDLEAAERKKRYPNGVIVRQD